MTDVERISELIILDATGIISKEDSAELLILMSDSQDFPWKILGEYQNLCALLSITVDQKSPSVYVKENILKIVKKIAERKSLSEEKSAGQSKTEENFESFELVSTKEAKLRHEPVSIKEPDLSELTDFNEENDFEEVKSKVALIKEKEDHSNSNEKSSGLKEFRVSEYLKEKPDKSKKSKSRNIILIAIVFLIAVVGIGFIFFVSSSESKEEDNKLIENHNEELVSKSESPEENIPVEQPAVNTEFVEPESQPVIEQNVAEEEIAETEITYPEDEQQNVIDNQKVELPEIEPPAIIEVPLSEPPVNLKDKPVTETNLSANNKIPPKEQVNLEEEQSYFVAVEEMPEPIGGVASIHEKIIYPEIARRSGIEGKVYVRAYVNESGIVTNAEVIKGIGMGCDEAAINAVLNTKFKPGLQRGKPIKVQVTIPITFKQK